MKRCFKCHINKPESEFYRHPQMADGRLNKCRECTKVDCRTTRLSRLEYYREYDRDRSRLPHRVVLRKKCFEKWKTANPEKRQAQVMVGNALRSGKLKRQRCEVCGSKKVHAHHDDYSKPLDVRWLCVPHHAQHHREMSYVS